MALIPEEFLNSVVAIGIKDNKDAIHWIGTGFVLAYFHKQINEKQKNYSFYIVTNKHVIQKQSLIIIRFSAENKGPAKDFPVQLHLNGKPIWTGHPNPKIDVAVINFNVKNVKSHGTNVGFFSSDTNVLKVNEMKARGIFEGDSVFALGYPIGLVNVDRQYVIVRNGSVARVRDVYDQRSKEFIIDAFVFPGNSGGPVLNRPQTIGLKGTKINTKTNLIGMVKSYIPYKDVAVSRQTGRATVVFEENTGLTSVIPVDFILETIQLDLQSKNNSSKNENNV